jgi:HD-GYP domain-containing protein (c-di-GMP phosphodiesterase class II)
MRTLILLRAVKVNHLSYEQQDSGVRLAEVVGALSLATDLGMGQPFEFALTSCILSLRLGEALGWSDEALRECYYQSLLRYIGCNIGTRMLASLLGDEFALRGGFAEIDNSDALGALNLVMRLSRQAGFSSLDTALNVARSMVALPKIMGGFNEHCEVAQRLAERFGFEPNIIYALGQLYERWDGKGVPRGLRGESVSPAVLLVSLAQDMVIFNRLGGSEAARQIARERRGSAYAPVIADCFCQQAEHLLADLDKDSVWQTVLQLEPGSQRTLTNARLDDACLAMADFVDIKSVYTLGHSVRVAALVTTAAEGAGLSTQEVSLLRRAALVHDIGKTGVSSAILEKPGTLNAREWEQVRLHPYYTERIFAHSPGLDKIGSLAALHHERMDGSGYHRQLNGATLSTAARLLAASNLYCALLTERSYRLALEPEQAAMQLRSEARSGRLDGDAVHQVLAAAGHHHSVRSLRPAGLSSRETEVLSLLARGMTIKQIAKHLMIAPKTADNHIQNIYSKLNISTRAAATLYAVENSLIG